MERSSFRCEVNRSLTLAAFNSVYYGFDDFKFVETDNESNGG